MKPAIYLVALLLPSFLSAQTVFWTETFGTAPQNTLATSMSWDNGFWTQSLTGTNGTNANHWFVSGEECGNAATSCGSACPGGDASLHVGSVAIGLCPTGDCGAAYLADPSSETHKRIESPLINTTGFQTITVSFNFIGNGEGLDDIASFVYSCDGGSNWTPLLNLSGDCCCLLPGFCGGPDPVSCLNLFSGQGYWNTVNVLIPACANDNPNFRFGFVWDNDNDATGADPSFAVDDITVSYDLLLPVQLLYFESAQERELIQLGWAIDSEQEATGFLLEHSSDGEHFESIFLQSFPFNRPNFEFQHLNPVSGLNYYRLSSINTDGRQTVLKTIQQIFTSSTTFLISPNPTTHGMTVMLYSNSPQSEMLQISYWDLQGRNLGTYNVMYDGSGQMVMPNLPQEAGLYGVSIRSASGSQHQQLVIY